MKNSKQNVSKVILLILFTILAGNSSKIFSQDNINSSVSTNTPGPKETIVPGQKSGGSYYAPSLDEELKQVLETGSGIDAVRIKDEMEKKIPKENIYRTIYDNEVVIEERNSEYEGDWLEPDALVYSGEVKRTLPNYKQMDMKMGEDGNMYMVVNRGPTTAHTGRVDCFKSTNGGANWIWFIGVSSPTTYYYGTVSMLVELRGSNPDSTRITVFYTRSTDTHNSNATLNYFSFRRNGSAFYGGQIAASAPGFSFLYVSAVSDGEFWNSATYLGVVCTEFNETMNVTQNLRLFRTMDWGQTWMGSTMVTGYNDIFPSADFKVGNGGSTDSVWIAVQRRFSETESHIRIISTPWSPGPSFQTKFITSGVDEYVYPCLTIKQNDPVDSAMITIYKNGYPRYLCTTNGGGQWNVDYFLGAVYDNTDYNNYTYCESSSNSANPFMAIWKSRLGDSLNVRRGVVGDLGSTNHRVNYLNVSPILPSVCAVYTPNPQTNLSAVAYAGGSDINVYADIEITPVDLSIKVILQGFYNLTTERLNMSDRVKLEIRNNVFPYNMIDSSSAIINEVTFTGIFRLYKTPPGNYYLVVKHRNSIETWSKGLVSLIYPVPFFDFTTDANKAYGDNMILVDNSPVRFGIYSGDVDQDGSVSLSDLTRIHNDASLFVTGIVSTDITGNGVVDLSDLTIAHNNSSRFVRSLFPATEPDTKAINYSKTEDITLKQNVPNPFNPTTRISFSLQNTYSVKLAIYDISGKEITSIINQQLSPGDYNFNWNGSGFSSGVYFFKLTATGNAGSFEQVRKMTLIK